MGNNGTKKITLLGGKHLVSEEKLPSYMFKILSWKMKRIKGINADYLKENIRHIELIYHPIWLAKLLVIADRKPFSPKKVPMMGFVDGVSGYRGLMSTFPKTVDLAVTENRVVLPKINEEIEVKKYIKDIQRNQINRSYVLKKPEHKIVEQNLVYLPLWKVQVDGKLIRQDFFINENTGESEEYMSTQWVSDKWITNLK